ncbi:MAG: RecX family transcriptional regulator [Treponema sp.]|nr:RecX family transcriptional regulator [Treponema sp.]
MSENENDTTTAFLRAEKTALRLIARAEQCTNGLARKLEKRGFDSACIGEIITKLTELKLLDDHRFACFWLRSRLRLTRSPRQLLSSLCARGIDRDDAETAFKTVLDQDTELALIKRYIKKYARKIRGKDRLSIKYFLKGEGFSANVIQQFLDEE